MNAADYTLALHFTKVASVVSELCKQKKSFPLQMQEVLKPEIVLMDNDWLL